MTGYDDAVGVLDRDGTPIHWEAGSYLDLFREVGVSVMDTGDESMGYYLVLRRLDALLCERPEVCDKLRGRRVLVSAGMLASEGTGRFGRTYTAVVSPEGRILSLSQFLGRSDAPTEVAHLDAFLQKVVPGLTFDCHEGLGHVVYTPAQRHEREPEKTGKIVMAIFGAIRDAGYPLADPSEYLARQREYPPYRRPYFKLSGMPGLFWVGGTARGVSYCLANYALRFGFSAPNGDRGRRAPADARGLSRSSHPRMHFSLCRPRGKGRAVIAKVVRAPPRAAN